ncbi:hypothetical protein PGB90_000635 [Kerria lacca]
MNFNDQYNRYPRGSSGRKLIKRPLETPGLQSNSNILQTHPNIGNPQYSQMYSENSFQNINKPYASNFTPNMKQNEYQPVSQQITGFNVSNQAHILTDPLVTNMAIQYGQALVGSGKQIVDKEIEKYVPLSRLKYYFAVDTSYVSRKLSVILFPFIHSDWSIKYDQNEPIQPKFEINAPDLYIPTMAFLTYVLLAGLILGMKNLFSPEKLSIEATNALGWTAIEVIIQLLMLYIANINTNLKTLDLIAYSSYKYVGIIIVMLVGLLMGHLGYIICLIYISVSLAFFLMRTLKLQILTEPVTTQPDVYGMPQQVSHQIGLKRRQYFLLFMACTQPILIWWFTWRIV